MQDSPQILAQVGERSLGEEFVGASRAVVWQVPGRLAKRAKWRLLAGQLSGGELEWVRESSVEPSGGWQ